MKRIFTLLFAFAGIVAMKAETQTIWTGSNEIKSWDNDIQALSWGGYDWSTVGEGTTLTVNLTETATSDYWQICLALGDGWAAINDATSVNLEEGATSYSYTLTASDLDALVNKGGLIVRGAYITVSSIVLTPKGDVTAIRAIELKTSPSTSSAIYNMAGQRVAAGTRGILIVNGKKMLVK